MTCARRDDVLTRGDVVLRRGATMRGVLADEKGRPVPQELIAVSLEVDGFRQRWTWTDASGGFEFSGLELEKYTLRTANHGAGGGPGHLVGEAWAGDLDVRAVSRPR